MSFISRSPWILHYDGSSCNGCDIEVLACLTPLYDVERFGVVNTGNPKHADIFLVTGAVKAAAAEYNGQIARGEDVISRIMYASRDAACRVEMQSLILGTLNALLEQVCQEAQIRPAGSSKTEVL